MQIFVDVDADGKSDLNLSVWQNFSPSYLARWTGSDWTDIRELPELVQTPGMISEHMSLSELQSAAGVPLASTIRRAGRFVHGRSEHQQQRQQRLDAGPYDGVPVPAQADREHDDHAGNNADHPDESRLDRRRGRSFR